MTLLLDTHALLWWLDDSPELSPAARDAIAAADVPVFVSAVSIWEVVIKESLGKLIVPPEFRETVEREPFHHLPVSADHAWAVEQLPPLHRDPFDRMLVAQCAVEGLTLVSRDATLTRYGIQVLGA